MVESPSRAEVKSLSDMLSLFNTCACKSVIELLFENPNYKGGCIELFSV